MSLHVRTPTCYSLALSRASGRKVWLKLESLQPTGSFKLRGIGLACQHYASSGVKRFVSSSGGNAGIAAAYAGRELGIPVTVVVPETTPPRARRLISDMGADILIHGASWQEANEHALAMLTGRDAFIHPFDDPVVWNGHSTIIDEVVEDGVQPDPSRSLRRRWRIAQRYRRRPATPQAGDTCSCRGDDGRLLPCAIGCPERTHRPAGDRQHRHLARRSPGGGACFRSVVEASHRLRRGVGSSGSRRLPALPRRSSYSRRAGLWGKHRHDLRAGGGTRRFPEHPGHRLRRGDSDRGAADRMASQPRVSERFLSSSRSSRTNYKAWSPSYAR